MSLDLLFENKQFSLSQRDKEGTLLRELIGLVEFHRQHCPEYAQILSAIGPVSYQALEDLPYLPVSLFKTNLLKSIHTEDEFKVMTSSGTTGQAVSRVVLDRGTADLQTRALTAVMRKVLGNKRLPMIIVDSPNVVKDRQMFSARGAGVLGMLPFGRNHFYALNDEMEIDLDGLGTFIRDFKDSEILIFGFTFMVWKYFLHAIENTGTKVDLKNGVLIHSGGWKKLTEEAVDNSTFKTRLKEATRLSRIHNFYGMVEQVGSVFLEGDDGYLYPSNFSDVIIRDPVTLEPVEDGKPGLVEVLSVLPRSYPGHILLTEDLGIIHGLGEPKSGWSGKRLQVLGRLPKSEIRGCSDTHAMSR